MLCEKSKAHSVGVAVVYAGRVGGAAVGGVGVQLGDGLVKQRGAALLLGRVLLDEAVDLQELGYRQSAYARRRKHTNAT